MKTSPLKSVIQPLIRHKEISGFTFYELYFIADSHRKVGIEELYRRLNNDKTSLKKQWVYVWIVGVGLLVNILSFKYLGIALGAFIAILLVVTLYIFIIQIKNLKLNIGYYTNHICFIMHPMGCTDEKIVKAFDKFCGMEGMKDKEERKILKNLIKKYTRQRYENILN